MKRAGVIIGNGYSVPIEEQADFNAARRGLLGIADRLGDCLRQNRCE